MRCSHLTLAIPYQPGTIKRTGKSVRLRQWLAIHLVAQQVARVQRIRRHKAAGEVLRQLDLADLLDAHVAAEEDDLDALLQYARLLEDGRQRRACPGGIADTGIEKRQAIVTRA